MFTPRSHQRSHGWAIIGKGYDSTHLKERDHERICDLSGMDD